MKLTELQSILGDEINKVRKSEGDEKVIKGAQTVAMLAKKDKEGGSFNVYRIKQWEKNIRKIS